MAHRESARLDTRALSRPKVSGQERAYHLVLTDLFDDAHGRRFKRALTQFLQAMTSSTR